MKNQKFLIGLIACAVAGPAMAVTPVTGDLFFVGFAEPPENGLGGADFAWDGTALTFSNIIPTTAAGNLAPLVDLADTDAVIFARNLNPAVNPNGNLLVSGRSNGFIFQIDPNTLATTQAPSGHAFHLSVDAANQAIYTSAEQPGQLKRVLFSSFGTNIQPTNITVVGANAASPNLVTELLFAPNGTIFYTNTGEAGAASSAANNSFGIATFSNSTTLVTTELFAGQKQHGMVYDPFSNTIIVAGGDLIYQYDLSGNLLASVQVTAALFGQSANFPHQIDKPEVDAAGHLFVTDNGGNGTIHFIDYSTSPTKLINDFVNNGYDSTQFSTNLEHVAVVWTGFPPVPEPTTALFGIGLGFASLAGRFRRMRPAA